MLHPINSWIIKHYLRRSQNIWQGQACVRCAATKQLPSLHMICKDCYQSIVSCKTVCLECGEAHNATQPYCLRCALSNKSITKQQEVYRASLYMGEMKDRICALKYHSEPHHAKVLAAFLHRAYCSYRQEPLCVDAIVAVPMHWRKVMLRGYNQAALLAKHLAYYSRNPWHRYALTKIKQTPAQQGLSKAARFINVRGQFQASTTLQNKHVGIVDDVITTGATMRACIRACLQVGAKQVTGLVVAQAEAVT